MEPQNTSSLIPLPQGKFTLIDKEDFERVNKFKWQYHPRLNLEYAKGRVNGKVVYLHRFLTNAKKGVEIDHINGNGLDNRRGNLRFASHKQNIANQKRRQDNSSGFKGVWIHRATANKGLQTMTGKPRKVWVAELATNGKKNGLGWFRTKEEAARAYDEAAQIKSGNFARRNFI